MLMIDVKGAINNLQTTVQDHFDYIKGNGSFQRSFPIHFELAYTDFRVIQMALQLSGQENHQKLLDFTYAYQDVYQYEEAFADGGPEGYNEKFAGKIDDYQAAVTKFLKALEVVAKIPMLP